MNVAWDPVIVNMWDMNGNCVAEGKPFTECVVEHEFSKDIFLKEHYISRKEKYQ